jgi:amino acid transporter
LFGIIYVGYKFWFKTRFWRSSEVDLDVGMRKDLDAKEVVYLEGELPAEATPKKSFARRLWENI